MTTVQERKLNMYLAVRDFIIPNEGITKDLPNFEGNFTTFKSTIDQIKLIAEMQKDTTTGAAKEKKRLKDNLINLAADNSRSITAFAKFTNNELLLDKVKFSISDLTKMTDLALKNYAQIIYNKGEANIGLLATYNITPETQKELNDAIIAYDASLAKSRVGISEKSQATNELGLLFVSAESTLENMDMAVGIIRRKQVNFFKGYTSTRKLVDTGAGILALKAIAIDLASREPVKGVLFTFKPEGAKAALSGGNGEITKKTAEKGSFHIKNMQAGTYKVSVSKPGYKEKEVTVSVADGERSELNVELEKA